MIVKRPPAIPKVYPGAYICASCRRALAHPSQRRSLSTASTSNTAATPSTAPLVTSYASYKSAIPPNLAQLAYANRFFQRGEPQFLFGSDIFRTLPASSVPEVAFLGRSNVGKSSLLNALLQRGISRIAHVSSKPGRTRQMNAFGVPGEGDGISAVKVAEGHAQRWVGRGGLVVLDMPGYGQGSREEWGTEILKYLKGRKQLRRTFLLLDCEHGMKKTDIQLLETLQYHGITHQIILSKVDKLLCPKRVPQLETFNKRLTKLEDVCSKLRIQMREMQQLGIRPLDDILTCSAEVAYPVGSSKRIGIDHLRWAVLSAASLDCDVEGRKKVVHVDVQSDNLPALDNNPSF